ncbi:peptide-N(4)-(N-acetyl-beta-glucosaminyl)asparagine amidase [Palaemon carinicauda]|uniref:peptide-N(4)-(N-acetyl-beta- glucosaminyl)asparagine amidase n=1 Tax=Palaemon carinicauda TaxID=392227 RepID=UPI0035B5DBF1
MVEMSSISSCVESLLENSDELLEDALETLIKIADNILKEPTSEKYRSVKLNNKIIIKKLIPAIGALEVLFLMGFEEGDDKLFLPFENSLDNLKEYHRQLLKLKEKRSSITPGKSPIQACSAATISSAVIAREMAFRSRLMNEFERVLIYESPAIQEKARQVLPTQELHNLARKKLTDINKELPPNEKPLDFQDCLLIALLEWFKTKFFKWFDAPTCPQCQKAMKASEVLSPSQEDLLWGGDRVEGYSCKACGTKDRFVRYNHPAKLLETRQGRCGEWANCFTLMCRTLGMDARYVHDYTDHVWTEVFSQSQNRWLHADSCENKMDQPLMYEQGWGKKLTYILAFSKDEIVDVTWRYTSDTKEVLKKRRECREAWLVSTILEINKQRQAAFPDAKRRFLEHRLVNEVAEFFKPKGSAKKSETEGRSSGSLAWRLARGETQCEGLSYVYKVTPEEQTKKEFLLKYSCAKNEYVRVTSDGESRKGWENGIHSASNVARKEETDWEMVYLARTEGSETGEVSWLIDWTGTGLKPKSILTVLHHTTFEDGVVSWQICTGDKCFMGNKEGVIEISEKDLEDNPTKLEISAVLQKGKGDCAWQHTQLFRQAANAKENFPFLVHIKYQ